MTVYVVVRIPPDGNHVVHCVFDSAKLAEKWIFDNRGNSRWKIEPFAVQTSTKP